MPNGKYMQIYCHHDGYHSGNGKLLLTHFKTTAKVRKLVGLGNMSSLAPKVSTTKEHSFDRRVHDVCVFYGRDRGEKDVSASIVDVPTCNEEFLYVWKPDTDGVWKWFTSDRHGINDNLVPLTMEMCVKK